MKKNKKTYKILKQKGFNLGLVCGMLGVIGRRRLDLACNCVFNALSSQSHASYLPLGISERQVIIHPSTVYSRLSLEGHGGWSPYQTLIGYEVGYILGSFPIQQKS
ncbi:hypothetical protein GOODEAATRI_018127 [Goodea atripinnis]|uniref:Uncharacterized protein n=1 Tax=Goodea atripinnis TaxID=208336 RepID=A0ABV0P5T7_9TELE